MNNTGDLSRLLAARRTEILDRWTKRIRAGHAQPDLQPEEPPDHLPRFFDQLLVALRDPKEERERVAADASATQGTYQLHVGLDLSELMRRYDTLTECILEEVEATGWTLSRAQLLWVFRRLEAARGEAVAAYISRRDAEMTRAHSRHLAFVAHEQRGLLMAALNALAVLRKIGRPEDEWALAVFGRSLTALHELIDQVLIADRLSAQPPLQCELLNLKSLLQEMVVDLLPTAARRQVDVRIDATAIRCVHADARLLRSAIGNILTNAVKFTRGNSRVEVRLREQGENVRVEVEDQCGGLPPCDTASLFQPFVQRGENNTGFGLGLAIVKQAIEGHGGRVGVHNLPDKGCMFWLEIPHGVAVSFHGALAREAP